MEFFISDFSQKLIKSFFWVFYECDSVNFKLKLGLVQKNILKSGVLKAIFSYRVIKLLLSRIIGICLHLICRSYHSITSHYKFGIIEFCPFLKFHDLKHHTHI